MSRSRSISRLGGLLRRAASGVEAAGGAAAGAEATTAVPRRCFSASAFRSPGAAGQCAMRGDRGRAGSGHPRAGVASGSRGGCAPPAHPATQSPLLVLPCRVQRAGGGGAEAGARGWAGGGSGESGRVAVAARGWARASLTPAHPPTHPLQPPTWRRHPATPSTASLAWAACAASRSRPCSPATSAPPPPLPRAAAAVPPCCCYCRRRCCCWGAGMGCGRVRPSSEPPAAPLAEAPASRAALAARSHPSPPPTHPRPRPPALQVCTPPQLHLPR